MSQKDLLRKRQLASGAMGRANGMPSVSTLAERFPRLIRRGTYQSIAMDDNGFPVVPVCRVVLVTPGVTTAFQEWFDTRESDRVHPRQLHLSKKFGEFVPIEEFVFKTERIDVTTSWDTEPRFINGLSSVEVIFTVPPLNGIQLMSQVSKGER